MPQLGGKADWALVQDQRGGGELGNAIGVLMGSSKFLVAAMAETLMPEDLGGVGGERLHMAGGSGGEKRVGAWRWPIRGNNRV